MEKVWKIILKWLMICVILYALYKGAIYQAVDVMSRHVDEARPQYCVVIDPGHGAKDPGKVGSQNILEKDINLSIALKLRDYLESQNVKVFLTRENDNPLYEEDCSNKKRQDMMKRIMLIEQHKPDLTVSIHQNSFEDSQVNGAQTFYYQGAEESRSLANMIQRSLKNINPDNHREPKENRDYYLLKNTPGIIVIVECGFLSNPKEEALLVTPAYQERIAWRIQMGIIQYLLQKQNNKKVV